MRSEKEDRSEEVRAKWPRQPGENAMECKCGRFFGKDDLLRCEDENHEATCPGHCPFCGQQVHEYRGRKI